MYYILSITEKYNGNLMPTLRKKKISYRTVVIKLCLLFIVLLGTILKKILDMNNTDSMSNLHQI